MQMTIHVFVDCFEINVYVKLRALYTRTKPRNGIWKTSDSDKPVNTHEIVYGFNVLGLENN